VSGMLQSVGKNEPPPELLTAIGQFNAGEYYACHETLEELWLGERSDIRRLYQGILQIGVGLYHLQRRNEAGARNLLRRGKGLLRPFAPEFLGIDLASLIRESGNLLRILESAGLEKTLDQVAAIRPRIRLID